MLLEAGTQLFGLRVTRGVPCGHHDIDRRQFVLIQAKRFARQPLDAVARHGGAECARRYCQTQSRRTFLIGHNRQAKIGIAQLLATLPNRTEFGRLVQPLARLECQPLDERGDR